MRNHLAFHFCLAFSSLLLSVLTAAPVLATAQDQSCKKNNDFLLFYTDNKSPVHSSKVPACELLKKVIEEVQDLYKCTSLAVRENSDAEDFQAIVTMEVGGNSELFNNARSSAASLLARYEIAVKDPQARITDPVNFRDPKSFEDYCANITQTTSTNSDEKNKDNLSPIEAEFVTRDEIDLSDFKREFGFIYSGAPQNQQEISDIDFAKNVIIDVQRAINVTDDGIWGPGSRKALLEWVRLADQDEPGIYVTKLYLRTFTEKSQVSSLLISSLSSTFSTAQMKFKSNDTSKKFNTDNKQNVTDVDQPSVSFDDASPTGDSLTTAKVDTQEDYAVLKSEHASFSKQIRSLANENKQLNEIVKEINSKFNKSQTEKVALQNKIDSLFTTPVLQNLEIRGVF